MLNFLEYVLGEVKQNRLGRTEALDLIRQYKTGSTADAQRMVQAYTPLSPDGSKKEDPRNAPLESQARMPEAVVADSTSERLFFEPVWHQYFALGDDEAVLDRHIAFICQPTIAAADYFESRMPGLRCVILSKHETDIAARFQALVRVVFAELQSQLRELPKGKILLQIVVGRQNEDQLLSGLAGFLKTAQLEHSNLIWHLLEFDAPETEAVILERLAENRKNGSSQYVRYENNQRKVAGWQEIKAEMNCRIPWRNQGIYLITGGVGGLGLIFARAIAQAVHQPTLILAGRSELTAQKQTLLDELAALGARVVYRKVDVVQESEAIALIEGIAQEFGPLCGMLHSAGIIRDNLIQKSEWQDIEAVLAPKVRGLVNLDQATRLLPLDFMVLFSSMTGALGNIGQAGYAAANAFMDQYAVYRNGLVKLKQRQGHTLSINWPLWQAGGMSVDAATLKYMKENLGLIPLRTENGIETLYQGLAAGKSQLMVGEGDARRLRAKLLATSQPHKEAKKATVVAASDMEYFAAKVQTSLAQAVSQLLKVKLQELDLDTHLTEYGFDSILFTEFANCLNQSYQLELTPPLFFEYATLRELTQYLVAEHGAVLRGYLLPQAPAGIPGTKESEPAKGGFGEKIVQPLYPVKKDLTSADTAEPIAIVGMSGCFPMAKDLNLFWDNLVQGRDCISEIPQERWDWRQYYGDPLTQDNTTNTKWGGFIEGVDQFDPLFFGISPREAEWMDPQQRLLMLYIWKTIEDAGYAPQSLWESNTGIFAGTMSSGYGAMFSQAQSVVESYTSTGMVSSVGPNRMSYFLNLHGPSEPVETACSSSLVAIHRAVSAIQSGQCEMAIAGGVNVIVAPEFHISFSKSGMLCADGRCKPFSDQANGYVRSEGVGMVLLKKLGDAEAAGDHIYGVIRATAVNHGGRANSLTAPNPKAQMQLLKQAYSQAGIDPRTVTYIEAHGTGTQLGDPIEINGLKAAFQALYQDSGDSKVESAHCGIGSVKSNIGHTELAAGIAGVLKVLLQMKHQTLVKSLHCERINPYIQLQESPFYIVQENQPWEVVRDAAGQVIPRRAGVSSFGFGGVNAHVVLEEYLPKHPEENLAAKQLALPVMVILSANAEQCLKQAARQLLTALQASDFTEDDLVNIAYTLQVGRDAMDVRLAFLAASLAELKEKLLAYLTGQPESEAFHHGQVKANKAIVEVFTDDEDLNCIVDVWIGKRKYHKLLEMWVKGLAVDWRKLYGTFRLRRVSLPTYPFALKRYWLNENASAQLPVKTPEGPPVHPMVHQNTSTPSQLRFCATFTGKEFFLADHVVKQQRMMPGVGYLEMVRAAVAQATGATTIRLTNVCWIRPLLVADQPVQVEVQLVWKKKSELVYSVYSWNFGSPEEKVLNCQGNVQLAMMTQPPVRDLAALQTKCQPLLDAQQFYAMYHAMGFAYGPGHQGVDRVYRGKELVLAKLRLPASVMANQDHYGLHPSLLDSALQASIALEEAVVGNGADAYQPGVPFALQEVEVFYPGTAAQWAVIQYAKNSAAQAKVQSIDLDLCDAQGNVCVRMNGLMVRALKQDMKSVDQTAALLCCEPYWREQDIFLTAAAPNYQKQLVILCEMDEAVQTEIQNELPGVRCLRLSQAQKTIDQRYAFYGAQIFAEIQAIMNEKLKNQVLLQIVTAGQGEAELFAGFAGLLKTAMLEYPKLIGQLIDLGDQRLPPVEIIKANRLSPNDCVIRYRNGQRLVLDWQELKMPKTPQLPWKERGVYLITGGAGGLGMIFAQEIARQVKHPVVVLTGRTPLDAVKQRLLEKLADLGAQAQYQALDITQPDAVRRLLCDIQSNYGGLDGIFHCAGVIQDNLIFHKTPPEIQAVLAPKVSGLVNLDEASRNFQLDFMVLFASGAGVNGNVGQGDYAMANAFMDAYAHYRNNLVARGERYGKTLAIDWPWWKNGGMQVEAQLANIWESSGALALETSSGIAAFYQGLAVAQHQMLVLAGEKTALRRFLQEQTARSESLTVAQSLASSEVTAALIAKTENYFKTLLAEFSKVPAMQIEGDASLGRYGINSVMILQLTNRLEQTFGRLPKTLFFEYQTLRELTAYFLSEHRAKMEELLAETVLSIEPVISPELSTLEVNQKQSVQLKRPILRGNENGNSKALDIAIIGVAGRYPKAENLQEFWKNLRDGKDCITEIPEERWDHSRYFDLDKSKAGKIYSKWGGFLKDVDRFDPRFFNISPREASLMDPQERLFLECVYETIEDAGYTRETLGLGNQAGLTGNVGVYVGVMYEEYQLYGVQTQLSDKPLALAGNPASIANRVSYFCNFHGPSMAIDTMCSSSLAAIHLACQALNQGECEVAIAGGVNLSLHPNKYLMLSQGRYVSSKGRCESFGEGGDGYVPSEGVGAVLLKPLEQAVADGDQIYGVIKASALNHGGRTNGYTVPNPKAQAAVIHRALHQAGINPAMISYVEAHGTGTSLGDPIEIASLSKVFQAGRSVLKQPCAIGSVKSNIGHCESAAGIAGLTKVLLQLKYQQLVPSLHSEMLNPNIDFAATSFIVQQKLETWKRPVVEQDGKMVEIPRTAGISAFGAGGSNAHLLIAEYEADETGWTKKSLPTAVPVVLSAKNEARLCELVGRILTAVEERWITDGNLHAAAYTLQTGREAMEERLGVLVENVRELTEKLQDFLSGKAAIAKLYRGAASRNQATGKKADDIALDEEPGRGDYGKLLELWVQGLAVDWNRLYGQNKPQRISLPTYPFARERYWIHSETAGSDTKAEATDLATVQSRPALAATIRVLAQPDLETAFASETDRSQGIVLQALEAYEASVESERAMPEGVSLVLESVAEPPAQKPQQSMSDLAVLQADLTASLAEALYMQPSDIGLEEKFVDLGLDSIVGVDWIQAINQRYATSMKATQIYNYPTIREFADCLMKELDSLRGAAADSVAFSAQPLTLAELIQQVQQGRINSEEANRLFQQMANV